MVFLLCIHRENKVLMALNVMVHNGLVWLCDNLIKEVEQKYPYIEEDKKFIYYKQVDSENRPYFNNDEEYQMRLEDN